MTQAPGALRTPVVLDYEQALILAIEMCNTSWVLAAQIPGLPGVKAKRSIEPTPEALIVGVPLAQMDVGDVGSAAALSRTARRCR
jgi:hypothetical protein